MGVIYKISNSIDGRVYIGSTINPHKRWNEHKRNLLNNKHQNNHLQHFVNKYGLDVLRFNVIEVVDNEITLIREQYYLDSISNKFNIANCASAPMLGKTHSNESLRKISERSSGLNNPMFGKKRPQWLIDKLTEASLGREKTLIEKIIRQINLPNCKEIILTNNAETIYCFSISHASTIVGVSPQSISKALNKSYKSKGWKVSLSTDEFYNKKMLFSNLNLFDENCHPQPELIQMLKSL
jgi:group I intron endonuclease